MKPAYKSWPVAGFLLLGAAVALVAAAPRTASPRTRATNTALDRYGGSTSLKCRATGWFHTEKIGHHWWLCTPLGNVFYAQGVESAPSDVRGKWDPASVDRRIESWGFNTIATGAYLYALPFLEDDNFPPDARGLRTNPVKMPFIINIRPALYAMSNPSINGAPPFLKEPVKNMLFSHSPYYRDWVAPGGIADYYDPGLAEWLAADLRSPSDIWSARRSSPYLNYAVGMASDDGDQTNGFGAGPDFPTDPPGRNNYNLAMQVAAMSPVQTVNPGLGFLYADTAIHSKLALRDFLQAKYGTIAALNAAWGSNYTTFDSTGAPIGGEFIGSGDGSSLVFTRVLAHLHPARFSLRILLDGTPIAGDTGDGGVWGRTLGGAINESTGSLRLVFKPGHAPARGALLTANYVQNGWGAGSGLLDEDGRPAHQRWLGDDWTYMSTAHPRVKADLNDFLEQLAARYFSACRDAIKAVFPHLMYLGPDSLSTYDLPSPAPVLRAAGRYLDAFITAGDSRVFTQAQMDYIERNFGDKPYFGSFYATANPDSAMRAYPNLEGPAAFATQAARGQAYYDEQQAQVRTAHSTAGNFPYIGMLWFDYTDLPGERLNWGLVTPSDNAYDGHEAVPASVPCSPPIEKYICGGERAAYGDLISSVRKANALWLEAVR